jgi:hypothetical protein
MGTVNYFRARTARIWTRVMREGVSIEVVARELSTSTKRIERVLFAIGKRRVAKETSQLDTQRIRRTKIAKITRRSI